MCFFEFPCFLYDPINVDNLVSCSSAATAKLLQSCPTLSNPMDCSPPSFPVPGILQARTLEWVAISFSNASKWKVKVKSLSHVRLLATPWTAAYQAPPSMGFSGQQYRSGVPLPCSSTFSKSNLYIWKFLVQVLLKPSLKDFQHNLISMGDEGNCLVV